VGLEWAGFVGCYRDRCTLCEWIADVSAVTVAGAGGLSTSDESD